MKQKDIIDLFNATETLSDKPFAAEDQWKIYQFRKALRSHVEFQDEREKQLSNKFIPYADEQGIISGEHYVEYMKEKNDIDNLNVEFTYEQFSLPLVEGISFKTIESLEGFIEFIK